VVGRGEGLMPYNVEQLTNEQLDIALTCYNSTIPDLEAKLLETSNADEVIQISEQLERLNGKKAAIEDEKIVRGLI